MIVVGDVIPLFDLAKDQAGRRFAFDQVMHNGFTVVSLYLVQDK